MFILLKLCLSDAPFLIFGLASGIIAAYYGAHVSEQMSRVMRGDVVLYPMLRVSCYSVIATSTRGAFFTMAQKRFCDRLSRRAYHATLTQPLSFYQETPTPLILQRAQDDVHTVAANISLCINVIIRSAVSLVTTIYLMSHISWPLTLLSAALIPVNMMISRGYTSLHDKAMVGHEECTNRAQTYLHETLSHISVIHSLGAQSQCCHKYDRHRDSLRQYHVKETLLYAANAFVIFSMPNLTTVGVLFAAAHMKLGTPSLITFVLHQQTLYGTVKSMFDYWWEWQKCKEPLRRMRDLLTSTQADRGSYIPNQGLRGEIHFDDVCFSYGSKSVFGKFQWYIGEGEKIAIVGPSGCGKSTLVKMLMGLLEPTDGRITVDGVDLSTYDRQWLRGRIGYVAQESVLFAHTIAYNIALGMDPAPSFAEIVEAAKLAHAHEFISALPDGYETRLTGTELGSLSGGQKQRIAIARALVRRPTILIFDEATSALDASCEAAVQDAIRACAAHQHMTILVIAHHESAIAITDKILRLGPMGTKITLKKTD